MADVIVHEEQEEFCAAAATVIRATWSLPKRKKPLGTPPSAVEHGPSRRRAGAAAEAVAAALGLAGAERAGGRGDLGRHDVLSLRPRSRKHRRRLHRRARRARQSPRGRATWRRCTSRTISWSSRGICWSSWTRGISRFAWRRRRRRWKRPAPAATPAPSGSP